MVLSKEKKMILGTFNHQCIQRNERFSYSAPNDFYSLFDCCIGKLCKLTISSGKLQFLKNWSGKGKRCVQKKGKDTIDEHHCVACDIHKKPAEGYTSHIWRRTAATNLADTGVSFTNLKRYRQWVSDAVVEGYIANSKPLREERLTCLMPAKKRHIE